MTGATCPGGFTRRFPAAVIGLLIAIAAAGDEASPGAWLERMAAAVETSDYEGTVIRRQDGETRAVKVVHKVVDGVVNEKVITQEGKGLEIIRIGNEVRCIVPEKKSVLIEQWSDEGALFSQLPRSDADLGSEYDLSLVRRDRVAGREAVVLAIRPHDNYRFGHRLWLDRETAFPLRTELVGSDGSLVEQIKFADINLESAVPDDALAPSVDLASYTWYTEPARVAVSEIDSDWHCNDLPPGFRLMSASNRTMPGSEFPVTHLVYGDGLATVSVFIAEHQGEDIARHATVGASSSYSLESDGVQITAVGEVPAITVQRIASGMRRRQ